MFFGRQTEDGGNVVVAGMIFLAQFLICWSNHCGVINGQAQVPSIQLYERKDKQALDAIVEEHEPEKI